MRIVVVDANHPDPEIIREAALVLRNGGLVAFPTETVYGLGANALDASAVSRIYSAKGRPAWNPVIVHVASVETARLYTTDWPASAECLAQRFWPGPLTIVVPRADSIPDVVSAGGPTVALRVPAHPVAKALINAAGTPIAAPSANRYTQVSPTTAQHVVESLGERVPFVLDGGPCQVGIESTVVECGDDAVTILRPGMIDADSLGEAVAGLGIRVSDSRDVARHPIPRSPGTAERHYAPNADVWLFEPEEAGELAMALAARQEIGNEMTKSGESPPVALLRTPGLIGGANLLEVRMPEEPGDYARDLYAALHRADKIRAELLIIEMPPDGPEWAGIRDRLTRAAR